MSQIDPKALFKIEYGLYVLTLNSNGKDNALIVNTVTQVASSPERIAVCINKANYSHDEVMKTKKMNVCPISEDAPFALFENFGFKSGRACNKFEGVTAYRTANGLLFPAEYVNAFISLEVENYIDLGSHGMFICTITDAGVISEKPTMNYSYYHKNVKPQKKPDGKKGYVCEICGYVYEGEELPEDFICPLCKHPASDFRKLS